MAPLAGDGVTSVHRNNGYANSFGQLRPSFLLMDEDKPLRAATWRRVYETVLSYEMSKAAYVDK
jgi:hypothetical protein